MIGPPSEHESPLFSRGIDLFNKGEYFECHEVLEELWRTEPEPDRQFTQGLIQLAVALHHLRQNNQLGATKLFGKAIGRLGKFLPVHRSIDVQRLLDDLESIISADSNDSHGSKEKRIKVHTVS